MLLRDEVPSDLDPDLQALLEHHVPPGTTVATVSGSRPNTVVAVGPDDVRVETGRSRDRDTDAPLVPAWMFNVAWHELRTTGRLRRSELGVHRSSAVCAVLAGIPDVTVVSTRPIELALGSPA